MNKNGLSINMYESSSDSEDTSDTSDTSDSSYSSDSSEEGTNDYIILLKDLSESLISKFLISLESKFSPIKFGSIFSIAFISSLCSWVV